MADQSPRDIETRLRRLEQTHDESERRLQQLMLISIPTAEQRAEALELSNSLPILGVRIRRLRLELITGPRSA